MMTDKRHANVALFVPHAGCPHDCCFCNQRTIAGVTDPITPQDVTAACEQALETLSPDVTAQIAFFGGSFTAIDRDVMVSLLQAAQPFLASGRFDGIRISTRPDAIDEERLAILKYFGVTAIELGAQSMDDRVLTACGRGHTAEDTRRAARLIKQQGFSLGLQMMTGLPLDSDEGSMETARQLAALCPDTMRIYPTVVLERTALAAMYKAGQYVPPDLSQTVALCARLLAFFEREQHIRVIRLGLHDGETLRSEKLAGGYHPALRELAEGQLYVNTAVAVLTRMGLSEEKRPITLAVNDRAVSKMIGQKRSNIEALARLGWDIRVVPDATVPLWEVAVYDEQKGSSL